MKNNVTIKNSGLTTFAKAVVYLLLVGVIAIFFVLFPELAREETVGKPNPEMVYAFLLGVWLLSVPIFVAAYQILKLIGYVEAGTAFSEPSVKALGIIKTCAIIFGGMVVTGAASVLVLTRLVDPTEDAAPVGPAAIFFVFVSSVVAAFVAVVRRVLQDAIAIKNENDSTV